MTTSLEFTELNRKISLGAGSILAYSVISIVLTLLSRPLGWAEIETVDLWFNAIVVSAVWIGPAIGIV